MHKWRVGEGSRAGGGGMDGLMDGCMDEWMHI
jgi:hypothetical protein